MAFNLERFVFSESVDEQNGTPLSSSQTTGNPLDEEAVEDLLSAKLMRGFMLLDQPCPKCMIPLVKQPAPENLSDKCSDAKTTPMTPRFVTQLSMADMPKSARGIPYCVACEQYVVTNEQETQLLDLQKNYDNDSVADTYNSIDTRALDNLNVDASAGTAAEGSDETRSSRSRKSAGGWINSNDSKDTTEASASGFLFRKSWSKWKRDDSSPTSLKSDVLGNELSKKLLGMVASRDNQGVEMKIEARDDNSAAFWKEAEKFAEGSSNNGLSKELLAMVASKENQGVEMALEARDENRDVEETPEVIQEPPSTPRFILSRPSVQSEFGITEEGGGDILNHDEIEETLTDLGVISRDDDGGDATEVEISEDSVGEIEVQSPRKYSRDYSFVDKEENQEQVQEQEQEQEQEQQDLEDDEEEESWSKSLLKLAKNSNSTAETEPVNTFEDKASTQDEASWTQPEESWTYNEDDNEDNFDAGKREQEKYEVEMLMNLASQSDSGEISAALGKIEETALAVQSNQYKDNDSIKDHNSFPTEEKEMPPSDDYNDFDYSSWIKDSLSHAASGKDMTTSSDKSASSGDDDIMQEYTVRREIATRVLGAKMLQGYTLKESQCDRCGMPQMEYQSILHCVVCPVLAKKAKKELGRLEKSKIPGYVNQDNETDIVDQYIEEREKTEKSKRKADRKSKKSREREEKEEVKENRDDKKGKKKEKTNTSRETVEREDVNETRSGKKNKNRKAEEAAKYVMQKQKEAREAKAEEARVKKRYEDAKEAKRLRKEEEQKRKSKSKKSKKKSSRNSSASVTSNDTESVLVASSAPDNIKAADARRKELIAKEKRLVEAARAAKEEEKNSDGSADGLSNAEQSRRKEAAARAEEIRNDQLRLIKEAKRLETMERMRLANEIEFQSSQESTLAVYALQGERKRLRREATRQKEIRAQEKARQEAELEARRIADEKRAAQEAEMIEALECEAQRKAKEAEEAIAKAQAALAEVNSAKKGIIAQTIAQGEADTVAETEALVRAEAEDYHEEQVVPSDSFLWRERWETLRFEGRSVMTRRLIAGWTMLPEYCSGVECQSSPLLVKGGKRECVVCGGTGTGRDGAYVAPTSDEDDELDVEYNHAQQESSVLADKDTISSQNAVAEESPYNLNNIETSANETDEDVGINEHQKEWYRNTSEVVQKIHEDFEEKRAVVSKEIGKRMLQGWTLLDMSCPHCVMPLLTDEEGENEICVLCGVVGKLSKEQGNLLEKDGQHAKTEESQHSKSSKEQKSQLQKEGQDGVVGKLSKEQGNLLEKDGQHAKTEESQHSKSMDSGVVDKLSKEQKSQLQKEGQDGQHERTQESQHRKSADSVQNKSGTEGHHVLCPPQQGYQACSAHEGAEQFVNMALQTAADHWMKSPPMLESETHQPTADMEILSKTQTRGVAEMMSCTPTEAAAMALDGVCHHATMSVSSGTGTGTGTIGGLNALAISKKGRSQKKGSNEQTSSYEEETSYSYGNTQTWWEVRERKDGTEKNSLSSELLNEPNVGQTTYSYGNNRTSWVPKEPEDRLTEKNNSSCKPRREEIEIEYEQELYSSSGDCPTDELTANSMVPIADYAIEPVKSEARTSASNTKEPRKKATEIALEKINTRRGSREKELQGNEQMKTNQSKTVKTKINSEQDEDPKKTNQYKTRNARGEPASTPSSFHSRSSRANKKGLTIDTSGFNNKEAPAPETPKTPRTPKTPKTRGGSARKSPLSSSPHRSKIAASPAGANYDELAARLRSLLADSKTPTGTPKFRTANSAPSSPNKSSREVPDYLISSIAAKQPKNASNTKHEDPPAMTSAFFGRRVAKDPEDRQQQSQSSPMHSPRAMTSPRGSASQTSPMHSPRTMTSPRGLTSPKNMASPRGMKSPRARPPFPGGSPRAAMSPSAATSPRPFLFPESPTSRIRRSFDENEGVTLVIPTDFDVTDDAQLRELILAAKIGNGSAPVKGKKMQENGESEIIDLIDMDLPEDNEEMRGNLTNVSTMTSSKASSRSSQNKLNIVTTEANNASGPLTKQTVHAPSPGEGEASRPTSFRTSAHHSKNNIVIEAMHPPSPGEDEASGRPFKESPRRTTRKMRPTPESMMNRPRTRSTPRRKTETSATVEFLEEVPLRSTPSNNGQGASAQNSFQNSSPSTGSSGSVNATVEFIEEVPRRTSMRKSTPSNNAHGASTQNRSRNNSTGRSGSQQINPEQFCNRSRSGSYGQADRQSTANGKGASSQKNSQKILHTGSGSSVNPDIIDPEQFFNSSRSGSSSHAGNRQSTANLDNIYFSQTSSKSTGRYSTSDSSEAHSSVTMSTGMRETGLPPKSPHYRSSGSRGSFSEHSDEDLASDNANPNHGDRKRSRDDQDSVVSGSSTTNVCDDRSVDDSTLNTVKEETGVYTVTASIAPAHRKNADTMKHESSSFFDSNHKSSSNNKSNSGNRTPSKRSRDGSERVIVQTSSTGGFEIKANATGVSHNSGRSGLTSATSVLSSSTCKSKGANSEGSSIHSTHFGDIISRIDSCKEKLGKSSSMDSNGNKKACKSLELIGKFTAAAADIETVGESSIDEDDDTNSS